MSSPSERHRELCEQIATHDYNYYVLDAPVISDRAYDALFSELKALEAKHPELITPDSPTQRVGERPRENVQKAAHELPMYSLDNTYNEDELREFDRRVRDGLRSDAVLHYVVEPKLDGASLEVIYEGGLLKQGITRGDGRIGEDVTDNVRTMRSLPTRIDDTRKLTVRGEVVIFARDLARVNAEREQRGEEPFANPRNAASGSLRLLDSRLAAERPLRMYLYELAEPYFETHSAALDALRELGLPTHDKQVRCSTLDEVLTTIHRFDQERHALPYETDGMVIKVDTLSQRDLLGTTARFPRWAIAYKFAAERAKTKVESITGDVGRTGAITPVANLSPVSLSGTTVSRASLHNPDYIVEKDVRVGDFVWIQKAGEIIPQVLHVELHDRPEGTVPWVMPTHCPVCGEPVSREEGEAALRCVNPNCPGRLKAALFHFTRRTAMNIDHLGRVLIEQLVDRTLVTDLADIFALPQKREALLALPRLAEKSVDNILSAIEDARTSRPMDRLINALGIPLVGTVAAAQIAEVYPNLQSLLDADPEEARTRLADIHGIGPKIADSVAAFLQDDKRRTMLQKMVDLGVTTTRVEQKEAVDGPLSGKSFCVTGVLSEPRKAVHAKIEAAGGEVHDRVKAGTTYLVAGEKVGASKLNSAKKHGAEVIDEERLSALLSGV